MIVSLPKDLPKTGLPLPKRDRRIIGLLAIILVAILVPIGVILSNDLANAHSNENCTCFDANTYAPASINGGTAKINAQVANNSAMNGTTPSYVQEIAQNDTIIFHSMNISIIAFSNSNAWVSTITNTSIPAYDNVSSLSNGFAIYHMYQPTLVIPRGAMVNITFVNMDYTDHHSYVLSTFPPPYPLYIMQNMANGGEMIQMTPLLPPVDNSTDTVSAYQYTLILNLPASVTHMWYMCMFPGHAMLGMYGNITLVDPASVGA